MLNLEIRNSVLKDIHTLAAEMRPQERKEAQDLGVEPLKALFILFRKAIYRKTILINDRIAGMWGVCGNLFGYRGIPFFVTTDQANLLSPLRFTRIYITEFNQFKHLFPYLEHYVSADYPESIRLLRLIGFEISKPILFKNGKYFVRATYKAANAAS